jgi:SNF1-activating kinase 1
VSFSVIFFVAERALNIKLVHFQGIIHRDIKPANLVWSHDRAHVKIADFGVAHFSYAQRLAAAGKASATDEDEDPILLKDAELSKLAGSPAFVAPDVLLDFVKGYEIEPERSPLKVTKATDIWALGVTLFGFFFGNLPFEGLGEYAVYLSIANDDWTPRSHMGDDQIPTGGRSPAPDGSEGSMAMHLLDQCLLKDPNQRITLEAMKVRISL